MVSKRKKKIKKMEEELEELDNELEEDTPEEIDDETEFGEPIINVNGTEVILDIAEEIEIHSLSEDQSKVSAQMAYWGSVWSAAEREKQSIDAFYRRWRAQMGKAILNKDPKLAEWKVKQIIDADKKFIQFKTNAAEAARNAILAKAVFESFKIKANALQSKGAQARAEFEATGMATKTKSDRTSAVRGKFKKK